ncbi:ABC transporter permease DevC [Synechococcus sp. PCC 7336]|uniref:ABC transporter permease DevC n=1 Tax=Synechococcus sp. PCC 7336 TaxID=195250 RepID=UPI000476EE36|nr:ABC transporter permease DevC [Synechococcus sp. PCC 7336]
MNALFATLRRRTPLGWLQLKRDRTRLLTAIAGIAFADILIFMQFGFMDALFQSNTQYPRTLLADIVLVSTLADNLGNLRTFPRRRIYQALDIPGVESVDALYVGSVDWRNPDTRDKASMMILGQSPDRPTFDLPAVNQQLDRLKLPDTVLFDRAARGDYRALIAQLEEGRTVDTEIGRRTIAIDGLFQVGASFADDGALITSHTTFLHLFPRRDEGAISLGSIELQDGADPERVREAIAAHLPDDVRVFTNEEYVDFELNYIKTATAISFVFTLGSAMGFVVGVVIVYQVLSTDVNDHLAEYATFKAMGYRTQYLLGVVFEEAVILSLCGFVPGVMVAVGLYQLTAAATALPLAMPLSRAVWVLTLTVAMCGLSGAIATRRLQSADPADIF